MIYAILTVIIIVLLYLVWNLDAKVRKLESMLNNYVDQEDEFIKVYEVILLLLVHTKQELDKIDTKGSFRADDEVGFTFIAIQRAMDTLLDQIDKLRANGEESK